MSPGGQDGWARRTSRWLARSVAAGGWSRTVPVRVLRSGLLAGVVLPLLRTRLEVDSLGAVPQRGPALLVANHASHLDTAVVLAALPLACRDRFAVAAAAEPFFDAWRRSLPSAVLFGAVPYRTATVSGLLAAGWTVLVFTEASRADDGSVGTVDAEVVEAAQAAAAAGVPVVPVGIRGTFAALPRGRSRLHRGRTRVSARFGPALDGGAVKDGTTSPLSAAVRTDAVLTGAVLTDAVRALIVEDAGTWWQVLRGTLPLEPQPGPEAARWRRIWTQTDAAAKGTRAARRRIWR